jgi:hypothetical protein
MRHEVEFCRLGWTLLIGHHYRNRSGSSLRRLRPFPHQSKQWAQINLSLLRRTLGNSATTYLGRSPSRQSSAGGSLRYDHRLEKRLLTPDPSRLIIVDRSAEYARPTASAPATSYATSARGGHFTPSLRVVGIAYTLVGLKWLDAAVASIGSCEGLCARSCLSEMAHCFETGEVG